MSKPDINNCEAFWLSAWYTGRWWLWLLWPLSLLFRTTAAIRRYLQLSSVEKLAAPVIVVGNISLGGTGKTPLIIALVQQLRSMGLRPGVLSRGYGGDAPYYPYPVKFDSPVEASGDEPLLIARQADCPVMVGSDRVACAKQLIDQFQCNILLSDDGLQHYKLSRQWEICVIDGSRGLGNGLCLPAGPLRESARRLEMVDCILVNGPLKVSLPAKIGTSMRFNLVPVNWCNLATGERYSLKEFDEQVVNTAKQQIGSIHAVTGIGNPQRFFETLRDLGVGADGKHFPDHHPFSASDLSFVGDNLLLMTAKDAIKCHSFAKPNWWYLTVGAEIPCEFQPLLTDFLCCQGLLID